MSFHLLNNCSKELSESTFTTNFRNINLEVQLKNIKNTVEPLLSCVFILLLGI